MTFYWVSKRKEVLRKCLSGMKVEQNIGVGGHAPTIQRIQAMILVFCVKRTRVNDSLNANIHVCLISPWFCPLSTNIFSLCD